jgi:hypothetical protein
MIFAPTRDIQSLAFTGEALWVDPPGPRFHFLETILRDNSKFVCIVHVRGIVHNDA